MHRSIILTPLTLLCFFSCAQAQVKTRRNLPGNTVVEFVREKRDLGIFTDPVDDTVHFKKAVDNIYRDNSGKIYILTECFVPIGDDTALYLQYYKDMSDFLDLKTYRQIKHGFFQNKGKVHAWAANDDGEYPVEVIGADPKTFVPFDSVGGGTDKLHVFYGGVPGDFEIIQGANPKTIKVLNPENGCWNCGNCYFADDKSVFFGLIKMEGADPKTFRLVNKKTVDAEDKNGKYFEGKRIGGM